MKKILYSVHHGFRWPSYLFFTGSLFCAGPVIRRVGGAMRKIMQMIRAWTGLASADRLAFESGLGASFASPNPTRFAKDTVLPAPGTGCRTMVYDRQRLQVQKGSEAVLSHVMPSDRHAPLFFTRRQSPTIQICYYESLSQLRFAANTLDHDPNSARLSVFMVLDDTFSGHLPTLISRQQPALQLVLAVDGGRLPGQVTVGDLDAACGALGWREIVFDRDVKRALSNTIEMLEQHDRLVVFWPAWQERQSAERLLRKVA
jgi:hypothetical protein